MSRTFIPIAILISMMMLYPMGAFSLKALADFYQYQTIVDPKMELSLPRFHYFLKNRVKKAEIKWFAPQALTDEQSLLKTFSITINQQLLKQLNANLPQSGKEHFVNAFLQISDEEKIKKIKLRYRGDNNYHWLYDKKSLRIKLRNDVYHMESSFNLINPSNMYSYRDVINYQLAKKLGLISPDCYPVRVKINGVYMGVYLYISQIDESILRKHKRMPGSIYYGDLPNQDIYENLWYDELSWDKKASRNKEQKSNREDIQLLLQAVNHYDEAEFNDFIETYLNQEAFIKFIALDRLLGSFHHDFVHNHKLYFDPYKGKFEPIAWDIRFWSDFQQKDLSLYPLQLNFARIPKFDAQVDKLVYQMINDNSYQQLVFDYQHIVDKIMPDLASDIYRDRAIERKNIAEKTVSEPFSLEQFKQLIENDKLMLKRRFSYLKHLYQQVDLSYQLTVLNNTDYKVKLTIDGNNPVKMDLSLLQNVNVYLLQGKKKIKQNESMILYADKKLVSNSQTLFDQRYWGADTVQYFPKDYELMIEFKDDKRLAYHQLAKQMVFFNAITGKEVSAVLKSPIKRERIQGKKYELSVEQEKSQTIELSGEIEIIEDQIFDQNTKLVIKAGTKFNIAANKSLFFYGQVLAQGSAEKPIIFKAQQKDQHWGAIVVQGEKASGSRFNYMQIKDGSITKRHLIHYTSPFNLHDLNDFQVNHCLIGKNHIGDDAMHIAYAQGSMQNNQFINARSDGLDIDISQVILNNNLFLNSGNDGLDIMTTQLKAKNNVFINNQDKGISVGEWSKASIEQSYFQENYIAVEIKDDSITYLNNIFIKDSQHQAINLYHKNKRYKNGGTLVAKNIVLKGKNNQVISDKKSMIKQLELSENKSLINSTWYQQLVEQFENIISP